MIELIHLNEEQLRDIASKNVNHLTSNSTLHSENEEFEYPQFLPVGKYSFYIFIFIMHHNRQYILNGILLIFSLQNVSLE